MRIAEPPLPPLKSQRLLDQVRERVRYLHYSLSTEQAYVHGLRPYVRHHGMRHPKQMGVVEVEAFLSWLAADRCVAVSTHRQAHLRGLAPAGEGCRFRISHGHRALQQGWQRPRSDAARDTGFCRPRCRCARGPLCRAATTCSIKLCDRPSSARWSVQASCARPHRTRCGIRSLRTCFERATTSARCKPCWYTAMSAPR